MAKDIKFTVDQDQAYIVKKSEFDSIVKEISIDIIPTKYIDQICVLYQDGDTGYLTGKDIYSDFTSSKELGNLAATNRSKPIRDIRLSINVKDLESDINQQVEQIIGRYC